MVRSVARYAPCGRLYASNEKGRRVMTTMPAKALTEVPELATALVSESLAVPSLTSVIGYSRVLVRRNSSMGASLKVEQSNYLELVKSMAPELPQSEPVPSAMIVGTAVHRVAEIYLNENRPWKEAVAIASTEVGTMAAQFDWEAFRLYSEALRAALRARILLPGHTAAEVTLHGLGWAGTADAVTHREVADWKSGRRLSIAGAVMQAVVLAETACRNRAVVIHLGQDAGYRVITVEQGSEAWDLSLSLFDWAVDASHARLKSDYPTSKTSAEILREMEPKRVAGVHAVLRPGIPVTERVLVRPAPF